MTCYPCNHEALAMVGKELLDLLPAQLFRTLKGVPTKEVTYESRGNWGFYETMCRYADAAVERAR
jgi:hypothetical protein